jgi:hypothetical protein
MSMEQIRTTPAPDTQGNYFESNRSNIKSQNSDVGGFIIPPPKVLWAWLSYVFEQTGEWLMPPTYSANDAEASNTVWNGRIGTSESYPIRNITQTNSGSDSAELELDERKKQNEQAGLVYQMPFPTMLPYAPVAKSDTSKKVVPPSSKPIVQPTGFDYVNSPYWQFAELALDKYAKRQVKPELLAGCKAALCLIVAWCNHPLFRTMSKRSGQWMTLGFERCAREIQMRASHFKVCLAELEEVGLITIGRISSDIISSDELARLRYDLTQLNKTESFWNSRSIQRTTTIYRLNVEVAELQQLESLVLPMFEPDALPKETNPTGKDRAGLEHSSGQSGKDLNLKSGRVFKREGVVGHFRKSVPVLPLHGIYDNDHDDDDEKITKNNFQKEDPGKRVNNGDYVNLASLPLQQPNAASGETPHTRLERLLTAMTPEQQVKFHFLNDQAVFPGFTGRGGRTTLDSREALKFAASDELSLEEIKLYYSQVKEMWLAGRCHTSPLGLLHWALTQNCDPRSTDEQTAHALFVDQTKRDARSKKQGNISHNAVKPVETLGQNNKTFSRVRSSFPAGKTGNFKRVGNNPLKNGSARLSPEALREVETTPEGKHTSTANDTTDLAPIAQNPVQVWQEVLEDLEGRWKLSRNDLALLQGSQLLLEEYPSIPQPDGSPSRRATVVLKSVVEERMLDLATRNIIQLCLRQKLGNVYAYTFTA